MSSPTPVNTREVMQLAPVVPVLVIDDVSKAKPLAEALVAGGLFALEITLRTPQALDAIRAMAEVESAVVGVGTALNASDLKAAQQAGARFAVSPGYTPAIGQVAKDLSIPLLPGVSSGSEIMQALEDGYSALKFFPAQQAGGAPYLKALGGPFQDVVFCPTGGVNARNASDYLSLSNVLCVGGSWVAPKELVAASDWQSITELAREAAAL